MQLSKKKEYIYYYFFLNGQEWCELSIENSKSVKLSEFTISSIIDWKPFSVFSVLLAIISEEVYCIYYYFFLNGQEWCELSIESSESDVNSRQR